MSKTPGEEPMDILAELKEVKLDSGPTVLHKQVDGDFVVLGIYFYAGSRYDPPGREGLAHLTEHCMAREHAENNLNYCKKHGIQVRFAATDYHLVRGEFFCSADRVKLRHMLNMYGNMFFRTDVTAYHENEADAVKGEFKQSYLNRKLFNWHLEAAASVFGRHRLGRYICPLGSPRTFARASGEEVTSYYRSRFCPNNCFVFCMGDIGLKELSHCLERYFVKDGVMRPVSECEPQQVPVRPLQLRQVKLVSEVYKQKPDHCELGITTAISGNWKRCAMELAVGMLESSLLKCFRFKHRLGYGFEASVQTDRDVHALRFTATDLPVRAYNVAEELFDSCVREQMGDLKSFREQKMAHLEGTKTDFQDLSCTDVRRMTEASIINAGRIVPMQETLDEIKSVTRAEVVEVLGRLLPENRHTFLLKPS